MSFPAIEQWQIDKPVTRSSGGVVAAQNARAAAVGTAVLGDGGSAVDAAVATAFALAVVEPWMSGLGGCGYLMSYQSETRSLTAVDFGTRAPRALAKAATRRRANSPSVVSKVAAMASTTSGPASRLPCAA